MGEYSDEQWAWDEFEPHRDAEEWESLIAENKRLAAEVAMLRPDAALGAAVRGLPDNHALRHYGALMLPSWYVFEYGCGEMVVSSAATPDAALRAAGLMTEEVGDD